MNKINFKEFDVVVVGAGLTGSIYANYYANKGKKVLVLEKRNHIAGNLYDFMEDNIYVQKYGPHCFHTNNNEVVDFIKKFSKWYDYKVNCEVFMHNKYTPSPFNFTTIDQFYNEHDAENLKTLLKKNYQNKQTVTILELLNSSNDVIRAYAEFLFKSDYSLYTAKQWGVNPLEVDPKVLKRVPVLLNYDNQYFYDKFQLMPEEGFTVFIENLLNHPNIVIKLNFDFQNVVFFKNNIVEIDNSEFSGEIIYTGEIDRLFSYKFGILNYRSLKFDIKKLDVDSYQEAPIVAYPEAPDFTRITEFKKFSRRLANNKSTIISVEYPIPYDKNNYIVEQYYPIINDKTNQIYMYYKRYAEKFNNLKLAGRLALFRYINMDQAIELALNDIYQAHIIVE